MHRLHAFHRFVLAASLIALLLLSTLAYAAGYQIEHTRAVGITAPPPMANAAALPPAPAFVSTDQAPSSPAALAPALSYFFISGNTFTPDLGSSFYARQTVGCVNQMPLGFAFSAPVNLPQASQVVSLTLYTYDSAITSTVSTAYFIANDGQGVGGYTLSAASRPNVANYQQNNSPQNNPSIIDNGTYNYFVQWVTSGAHDSPYLSLCGVRVAYHAPLGVAAYLPLVDK